MMFTSFTNITEAVNFTFLFILAISVALLALITLLMIVFVIKYRRKNHPTAVQIEGNVILEVVWTVIPTVLVLAMFYYGWIGYKLMRTPPEDAMEVTAIGRMWSWEFKYENGKRSNELRVPAEKAVKVNLESQDVIHSFYVPAFMVKMDVVPGLETFVWFNEPDTGVYDIFCAEFCGLRHSYMLSRVVVVPEAEFDQWVVQDVEVMEAVDETASEEENMARLIRAGERLMAVKGCVACHTTDGTAMVGPSYKGLFGKVETVISDGTPREITVDEEYLRTSILDPNADLVEGFQPLMPPQEGLITEEEIKAIIEYIKSVD